MKSKIIIYCVLVAVIVFTLGFTLGRITMPKDTEKPKAATIILPPQDEDYTEEDTAAADKADEAVLQPLKDELNEICDTLQGDWAVYVEDLSTGESIAVNNKKMISASLIKLFIMGQVYQEIENGSIEKEDVSDDLKDMIVVSDNDASNRLVAKLGGGEYANMNDDIFQAGLAKVNSFAAELNCTDTEQQRDMLNSRPNPISEENYTSVEDCGKLLSMIYNKTLVSEQASEEMYDLLSHQTRRHKIPSGLPADCKCANKTGELRTVENDVAIILSPSGAYTLCIMSNNIDSPQVAQKAISDLSKKVYEFYTLNYSSPTNTDKED